MTATIVRIRTSTTLYNYFFLVVGIIKFFSLNEFDYSTALLSIFTLLC